MSNKFRICRKCGNLVGMVHDSGVPLICCGEKMEKLVPNTTEAATEKHIPEVSRIGDTVKVSVGSVLHPMTEEHYIEWIALSSNEGVQIKWLKPGEAPIAEFKLTDPESIVEV